ncbi:hypothetical protein BDV93DRAFT_533330 [Ceratobasidium sp. AG-I]|nr:hypothetical protein BDV93DRAFT_533330 [Ceratobasidium sp. AG-I]
MSGSRWTRTRDALAGLAKVVLQYDDDGIEIFFLNAVNSGKTVKTPEDVMQLFDHVTPSPGTPTGARLDQILSKYISRIEMAKQKSGGDSNPTNSGIKPLNLIVITDGAPSDSPEKVIIAAAKRLDAGDFPLVQVGIQFIQVGSDVAASKALRDMDDHLGHQNGLRDIVDTRPFSGKGLTADHLITMLVGGINRRVDRMANVPELKN